MTPKVSSLYQEVSILRQFTHEPQGITGYRRMYRETGLSGYKDEDRG